MSARHIAVYDNGWKWREEEHLGYDESGQVLLDLGDKRVAGPLPPAKRKARKLSHGESLVAGISVHYPIWSVVWSLLVQESKRNAGNRFWSEKYGERAHYIRVTYFDGRQYRFEARTEGQARRWCVALETRAGIKSARYEGVWVKTAADMNSPAIETAAKSPESPAGALRIDQPRAERESFVEGFVLCGECLARNAAEDEWCMTCGVKFAQALPVSAGEAGTAADSDPSGSRHFDGSEVGGNDSPAPSITSESPTSTDMQP